MQPLKADDLPSVLDDTEQLTELDRDVEIGAVSDSLALVIDCQPGRAHGAAERDQRGLDDFDIRM